MKQSRCLLFIASISLLLSGCGTFLIPVKPDAVTGKFRTHTQLTPDELKVFEPIDNLDQQNFKLLLGKTSLRSELAKTYSNYLVEMLGNCGLDDFVDKAYLENFIIDNNLVSEVPSLDDRIGYHNLSKYTGNYLVLNTSLIYYHEARFRFTISVYDPVAARTKFYATRKATNHVGIDKPIMLPVFNALKKWVDESKSIQKE